MNRWSVEPLKGPAIYRVPLVGIISILFGWICTMIHVVKVQPEDIWLYRNTSWARLFIDSELEHVAEDFER